MKVNDSPPVPSTKTTVICCDGTPDNVPRRLSTNDCMAAKTSGAGPEMERVAEASNWPGKNLLLPKKPGGRNLPTKNKRHQFGWYPCVNFWLNPQIWVWDYMLGLLRPNFYENFKHPKHVGESGDVLEWELLLDAFWICTSSGLIPASFCCWFHHESSMMSSAAI